MPLKPIPRRSLTNIVSAKLAASILDGSLASGSQLPSERELMAKMEVSRSTIREALRSLEESTLIESRPGVGWFVKEISQSNIAKIHELAQDERIPQNSSVIIKSDTTLSGPRRLPASPEKPLRIPNLRKDRLGTFNFISWWERDKVENAKILVVGAGALGNEVIKNLVLMGVGNIYIIDFDTIEAANLSRSPLFRESDSGRKKAEVAAARAKELNPNIHVQYLHGDVTSQIGLGVIRRMDVIIGCLDNREARLSVNRYAYWMNKPWVDGAIQELLGLMRVFVPGQGACFECTLNEQARQSLAVRYSCPLLARQNVLMGKVPTTPTISAIIGGMQSQEALKILNDMPIKPGKVVHFNGMTNEMHTTAYLAKEDCESHWTYGEVTELPLRAETTTLTELLRIVRSDLGSEAVLELDQELIIDLECSVCKKVERVIKPISEVSFEAAHCPICETFRETNMTHTVTGEESFLHHTLASIGVPPLHIMRAYNLQEYRFYELTGDLHEALHFSHFEESHTHPKIMQQNRIRIGDEVELGDDVRNPAHGKITFHK
ncbi:MAG: ThiF family adenylyltransferase [Chloroflexi bacterium]|nr:ThiF family adenylyltransferase [Chloroflexota bacterium]